MNTDDLKAIINRIANKQYTEEDITLLQQLVTNNPQTASQIGKNIVNIGEGKEIHIGDHIYQVTDAEAIREIVATLIQEIQKSQEPICLASELVATLNNAKFQGEEGEQRGTGSFYQYEIYLENLIIEDEQNQDIYQNYKLSGNWFSHVYKYIYAFDILLDRPWGYNKKPYGRFQVVVKTINGVLDQIRVQADRYNDEANNYAANKVEQLIESKIKEIKHKN
ncbi:hypothetical protein ANA_C13455 [Anabaena sp. 90]|uniref:hypothetical protein n=1 Tax=Anabaena sp. 90 TaxID=46234 RepID=UPI00029B5CA9|nr:hypothetical protein [Anabaena sp. 90]AFW96119.1 hypothetical protein ANA_C13455 [Anabaena sp. 90]